MSEQVFGMPVSLIGALIAFAGSVLFAPLMTKAVAGFFDKKSKLNVNIYAADIETNTCLKKLARTEVSEDLSSEERSIRRLFQLFHGYIRLKISNTSNSIIKSIVIAAPSSGIFEAAVQIESNEKGFLLNRFKCVDLGNLQLGRSINVHLYSMLSATDYGRDLYKKDLQITADLIDKVTRKLIVPQHILQEKMEKRLSMGNVVSASFFIISIIFLISQFYIWGHATRP